MKAHVCIAVIVTALLSGCATAPALQKARPSSATAQTYVIAKSETTIQTNHMTQHLDAGQSIVYFQNQGGGGVGLGLLLGPLGVAANISMIEKVTLSDVEQLKGKLPIDPVALFRSAAIQTNSDIADQVRESTVRATPYLRVSKTDESTIHVTAALVLEQAGTGPQEWKANYSYQLPGSFSVSSLAQLDDSTKATLASDIRAAFQDILNFVARDTQSSASVEQPIQFKSAYVTPRFEFEQFGSLISDDGNVVWVRAVGGIFAIRKPQVTYSVRKS